MQPQGGHKDPATGPQHPVWARLQLRRATFLRFALPCAFAGLFALYTANGQFLPAGDCKAIVFQPVVLLSDCSLAFTPHNAPFMFRWVLEDNGHKAVARVSALRFDDPRYGMPELERAGKLKAERESYFLAPTRFPAKYANTYGPLPGLMLLPSMAALAAVSADLRDDASAIWQVAKVSSALYTVLASAFLYAAARAYAGVVASALAALAFALGSVAWPVASQVPCQQTFSTPWLALGLWSLTRPQRSHRNAWLSGFALGWAGVVRAPLLVYPACILAWFGFHALRAKADPSSTERVLARKRALAFAVGAAIPIALLLGYNAYVFGDLLGFGQLQRAEDMTRNRWGTPFFEGLAGVLVSPSRGLFVYSPVLLFSALGLRRMARMEAWSVAWPLALASVVITCVYSKWYSWWGGWSFGPRLMFDVAPVLCLFLAPAWDALATRVARVVFVALLAASIACSALGAVAFDVVGWNARETYTVRGAGGSRRVFDERAAAEAEAARTHSKLSALRLDVDKLRYRYRLFSLADSPLVYYATHLGEARQRRLQLMRSVVQEPWR